MKIVEDDYTFTSNDYGSHKRYGTGGECNNYQNQGKIRMNLYGTDFKFQPSVSLI